MKLRYELNNNSNKYRADVFESKNGSKIIVEKRDTTINEYDPTPSVIEKLEFSTITEYENWLKDQEWVEKKKIKRIQDFVNVKRG